MITFGYLSIWFPNLSISLARRNTTSAGLPVNKQIQLRDTVEPKRTSFCTYGRQQCYRISDNTYFGTLISSR